jgi:hypothetical protein
VKREIKASRMSARASIRGAADAEKQLKGFIEKFEPRHRTLIREVRRALRRRFPAATELVYDNYNFFVMLACPEVENLLATAVAHSKAPLPATGRGNLIIRSVSAKQRPRRKPAR